MSTNNNDDSPTPDKKEDERLGFNTSITRRDFVGSTVLGTGAALLAMEAPGIIREARAQYTRQTIPLSLTGLGPDWTGPGGIGDYAKSPGNTYEVVNASHGLMRDSSPSVKNAEDTGETYDLVVVGGGFAGMSAAYNYRKERPNDSVLIMDVHPIFGGEAKQNEFEVDGYHLWGPQGSNGAVYPFKKAKEAGFWSPYWDELGLPDHFEWQNATGMSKELLIPRDVYGPMYIQWEVADQGFYYDNHGWVKNPWKNRFKDAPIPDQLKRDYIWMEVFRQPPRRKDWAQWLDTMTYHEFITNIMGIKSDVCGLLNHQTAAMGCGLGCDVISAYSAYDFLQPGVNAYNRIEGGYLGIGDPSNYVYLASFPGGNTGILRHFVKKLIPGAIAGTYKLSDVLFGKVQWQNLDRPNQPVRMRMGALGVDIRHDGSPESAKQVNVVYHKDGKLYRIRGKRVVVAGQQMSNKHIVKDLPPEYMAAMNTFGHAPMLVVNVALRNWKFMENLGISAARWFEGFGWFVSLRKQMIIDGKAPMPLDPAKPTVLTMYNSFPIPGLPVEKQTVAARMQLFGMSFKDIERGVREQFTKMFSPYGFDPKRDIAGIVANRWGHAYVVSPPGFYFGRNGKPAPRDVIRQSYGRIAFAHSELTGAQMWENAAKEGERAAKQVAEVG